MSFRSTAVLVILLTTIPADAIAQQATAAPSQSASEVSAAAERYHIPETVSPEAAKIMNEVYSAGKAWFTQALQVTDPRAVEAQAKALPKTPDSEVARTASKQGVAARVENIGGIPVVRIQNLSMQAPSGVILSVHGGGYISGSAKSIGPTDAQLAKVGFEVISIDYTLAPHAKWQQTTDEVVAVWRSLVASGVNPQRVAFMGASAGGGLAAGSLLKARDQGLPMPAALVLLSPWADISANGDTYRTLARAEPLFPPTWLPMVAGLYADPADQKNPYVSPVYGDFSKAYPATLIQGGTREVLLSGFVRQYQAVRKGGHEAVLDLYEGMPHCFQDVVADSPEARTARQTIVAFMESHLSLAPKNSTR